MKTKKGIVSEHYNTLNKFDAIICNPPQYDQKFFSESQLSTKRGFVGKESELVGGKKGYEFITELLEEVATYDLNSCVYFQLTLPKLLPIISSYLHDKKLEFISEIKNIGTRKRFYFRVNFSS